MPIGLRTKLNQSSQTLVLGMQAMSHVGVSKSQGENQQYTH
uniref:Uncharacterized protein n=1 Tax=Trichinella nativa TaxID=6335 RepID=A0A0V1KH79_9BILA